jgi:hypothetical protein
MDFKLGQSVKPKEIDSNTKEVIYEQFNEEGVLVDVLPTKAQCEIYGFRWNITDSRCHVKFQPSVPKYNTLNSVNGGANHYLDRCVNNTINGTLNSLGESNTNNLLSGRENSILSNLKNSVAIGTLSEATVDNALVQGGNHLVYNTTTRVETKDIQGERQYTRVLFGVQTTAGSTVTSYLNNDNTRATKFPVPTDTAMYFNAHCLAVRVGGENEEGAVGDFASWMQRGVVINKDGTLSVAQSRRSIASSGVVTDWRPTGAFSGTDFQMNVRGETNCIIEWVITVEFTEIRTGVNLGGEGGEGGGD